MRVANPKMKEYTTHWSSKHTPWEKEFQILCGIMQICVKPMDLCMEPVAARPAHALAGDP